MNNFEVTNIAQLEDPLTHFILFSVCNFALFTNVVKKSKWKTKNIWVIEKSNTWELVKFSKDQKIKKIKNSCREIGLQDQGIRKGKLINSKKLGPQKTEQEFGVDY